MASDHETVLILDFGSQYTQLIARRVRELGVYSEIVPGNTALAELTAKRPSAFILSGSPASGYRAAAPMPDPGLYALRKPLLGICYGFQATMQLIFLFKIARLEGGWSMSGFVTSAIATIRKQVGEGHILCGLSGGVDSTVVATLCHRAVGKRLICVLVDHGLLREREAEQVAYELGARRGLQVVVVDARRRFLDALAGVTDPEE